VDGFARFDTAIGTCGVAWGPRGIRRVLLPPVAPRPGAEADPPEPVRRAIAAMTALLDGEPADLSDVALDDARLSPLQRDVYAVARAIPPGATLTYGEVARRIGRPGGAQAVGRALGANPFPIVVPCHRVVAAGGDGGFSAPGGVETKRRMLAIEGATLDLFAAS